MLGDENEIRFFQLPLHPAGPILCPRLLEAVKPGVYTLTRRLNAA